MRQLNSLDSLLNVWEKLGERERVITLTFLHRLYAGQRKYGKISPGKKSWGYEAIEEALDASVYLSCMLQDKADTALEAAMVVETAEVETPSPLPEGFIEYLEGNALPVQDSSAEAAKKRIAERRSLQDRANDMAHLDSLDELKLHLLAPGIYGQSKSQKDK